MPKHISSYLRCWPNRNRWIHWWLLLQCFVCSGIEKRLIHKESVDIMHNTRRSYLRRWLGRYRRLGRNRRLHGRLWCRPIWYRRILGWHRRWLTRYTGILRWHGRWLARYTRIHWRLTAGNRTNTWILRWHRRRLTRYTRILWRLRRRPMWYWWILRWLWLIEWWEVVSIIIEKCVRWVPINLY